MEKLILIGAGGHAKSVIDSICNDEYDVCGFLDEYKKGKHLELPILGHRITDIKNYKDYVYFVSIGDNSERKQWYQKIETLGLKTVNIIDKTAIISKSAVIGNGNFIAKLAVLNADSKIGDNNIINTNALVEHECRIGNNIHVSTMAAVNGNVVIEDDVFIGSAAVLKGQVHISKHSIVGAGSVVIHDVEPYTTVVGVPAKILRREPKHD